MSEPMFTEDMMTRATTPPDLGPWHWRLRCLLADRLALLAGWVEPEDRTTVHVVGEGGLWVFHNARRR